MTNVNVPAQSGGTEAKTKAAGTAAGVGSFVLLVVLGLIDQQELLEHVPDVLTGAAGGLLLGLTTFAVSYAKAHVPGKLSQSAVDAFNKVRRGN